jgi:hypothetical protein
MMQIYVIQSDTGLRVWQADDVEHAIEQHNDAFPDEQFIGISIAVKASSEYPYAKAAD